MEKKYCRRQGKCKYVNRVLKLVSFFFSKSLTQKSIVEILIADNVTKPVEI